MHQYLKLDSKEAPLSEPEALQEAPQRKPNDPETDLRACACMHSCTCEEVWVIFQVLFLIIIHIIIHTKRRTLNKLLFIREKNPFVFSSFFENDPPLFRY